MAFEITEQPQNYSGIVGDSFGIAVTVAGAAVTGGCDIGQDYENYINVPVSTPIGCTDPKTFSGNYQMQSSAAISNTRFNLVTGFDINFDFGQETGQTPYPFQYYNEHYFQVKIGAGITEVFQKDRALGVDGRYWPYKFSIDILSNGDTEVKIFEDNGTLLHTFSGSVSLSGLESIEWFNKTIGSLTVEDCTLVDGYLVGTGLPNPCTGPTFAITYDLHKDGITTGNPVTTDQLSHEFLFADAQESDSANYQIRIFDTVNNIFSIVAVVIIIELPVIIDYTEYDSIFIVEFPSGESTTTFQSLPVMLKANSAGQLIQAIDTGVKANGYWTDWGGLYGLPETPFFVLFIEQFLTRVENIDDLYGLSYSSLVIGTVVYYNIPFYLWQIEEILSRIEFLSGYSTSVKDYLKPSDDKYNGVRYPARLKAPSLPIALSDPLNGINISPTFSVQLMNNDGFFDIYNSSSILNNPVTIKRSTSYPAFYSTFKTIRMGEIENIKLNVETFTLSVADALRTLEDPATRTFEEAGITNIADPLPLAYGDITNASLIEFFRVEDGVSGIVTTKYVVCDPLYFVAVNEIRNTSGDILTDYTIVDSIITFIIDPAIPSEIDLNPSVVDFSGKNYQETIGSTYGYNNTVGNIIIQEVSQKTKLSYIGTLWNKSEIESYAVAAPTLAFYFKGGSIKQLVVEVLKSDMAFFIQQNTGRMTIRRWVETYSIKSLQSWVITKRPHKTFSNFKYYYSSTLIEYGGNIENQATFLNNNIEDVTVAKWKKKNRGDFSTALQNVAQAETLSNNILLRFANRPEIWVVSVGKNTASFELLDALTLPIIIQAQGEGFERKMSEFSQWRIIGVNPSDDTLTLEEYAFDEIIIVDGRTLAPLSQPLSIDEQGYNSHILSPDESGILSMNAIIK